VYNIHNGQNAPVALNPPRRFLSVRSICSFSTPTDQEIYMNLTPVSQQLQGTVVLKKQQILETRELAFAITDKMSDRQLLTHMGILNSLIWRAATDYQAIRKDDNGVERVVSENWNNLLVCSVQGEVQITIPVDWTGNYLRTYWPGAFHDQKTVRTYRKQQLSWGLFAYDIENRPKGAAWGKANGIPCQGIATPPVLERVDVARILIFYQMFDQIRRSRINEKLKNSEDVTAFNCMPDHGGMVMVELYNALFLGVSEFFGGSHGGSDIVIGNIDPLPATKVIVWEWKKRKDLFRALWERMVIKAGFVAKQALKIAIELVVEPLGELAEVPF
jgi:hypothetical protein